MSDGFFCGVYSTGESFACKSNVFGKNIGISQFLDGLGDV